jgi:hypothetical protein
MAWITASMSMATRPLPSSRPASARVDTPVHVAATRRYRSGACRTNLIRPGIDAPTTLYRQQSGEPYADAAETWPRPGVSDGVQPSRLNASTGCPAGTL